ncbi:putative quinol monooxygenase [Halarcobacter sp.]|uniref:putative quinol monooxygenase n=1 Tax=Halarcobacter sp. TaxID=2321133 RepID=UPI003B00643C
MSNIVFTVKIKVKEEFTQIVYPFMQAMHKLTHDFDEGFVQYDLFKDKEDENKFYFIEEWDSEKSLEKHKQKEHYKSFIEFLDDKVESIDKVLEKIDTSSLEKVESLNI